MSELGFTKYLTGNSGVLRLFGTFGPLGEFRLEWELTTITTRAGVLTRAQIRDFFDREGFRVKVFGSLFLGCPADFGPISGRFRADFGSGPAKQSLKTLPKTLPPKPSRFM